MFRSTAHGTTALRNLGTMVIALFMAGTCMPTHAEPVWVAVGANNGQGQTFVLGRVCYAYTAGHVVKAKGTDVVMTDREGFQVNGRAIAVDTHLDLALISVTDNSARAQKLCAGSRAPTMIRLESALARFRSGTADVWLDKITSAAGGLSRFELELVPNPANRDRLLFVPGRRKQSSGAEAPTHSGESGASIWLSEQDSERIRYGRDGEANLRHQAGTLLGVHVGTEGGRSVAVRSDALHEFIFQALQPVRWNDVVVEPATVKTTASQRGPFGAAIRDHFLSAGDAQLDHLAFEFDLGTLDNRVLGVRVSMAAAAPGTASRPRQPSLRVSTSQFRPGEAARAAWDRGNCEREARRPAPRQTQGNIDLECRLQSIRNAGGMRVEVMGNPSMLRRLTVLLE